MTDDLDAMQRRIAELEALTKKQSQELQRLKHTLRALPVFVYLVDTQGNIIYANYPLPDTSPDVGVLSLVIPEQHEEMRDFFRQVIKSGKQATAKIKQAQSLEWYSVRISPPNADGLVLIVGENIHEQRMYEQALARSEQRYRMITALSSDYAFSVIRKPDGTDQVTWITNTVSDTLNAPQAIRANSYDISELVIHKDDNERVFADVERTLNGKSTETEYRAVTKTGEIRRLRVARMPMWDEEKQKIIGYYAAANDITEETRAAEVRIEKEKLETALTKERELADLKSHYMSMLVHEFRTPLTIVMSNSSLIYTYWEKLSPEKRSKSYQSIVKSINYLSEMLQDLSLFIRSERGYIEYQPESIDLVALCSSIIDDIRQTDGREHLITFNFDPATGVRKVDPALLKHILVNLLSNAIKYSPAGSEITFGLSQRDGQLVFDICDQGIGIPEADLQRIFEPFHRGENVDEVPGTGIGLAIVHEAVEAHHGSIEIDSEPGKGTQVTFTIPVKD
ncbi:MAG: PAS domain-containing sensor histidine kinase [Chloroflexi bacterium]|nr:PAS domain-containing sensor histidine kinase [Chloroflexota bacterium]